MKNSLDQLESRYVDLDHMHERAESLEHHAEDFAKQVHTEGYKTVFTYFESYINLLVNN